MNVNRSLSLILATVVSLTACGGGGGGTTSSSTSSSNNNAGATPPATITGASVQSSSATSVSLTWPAVSGASYYEVLRSLASGSTANTFTSLGNVTTNAFVDNGLTASTAYVYRLLACSNVGCSGNLDLPVTTSAPPVVIPAAPAAPTAGTITTTQIVLNWASVSGASSYQLQRNGFQIANAATISGLTYTDTGLSPATSYAYQVQACNSAGCSTWSPVSQLQTAAAPVTPTPPTPTPPTPTGPAVPGQPTALAKNSSSVTVSWASVTGASRYVLTRNGVDIGGTTLTALSFIDTGLSPNTAYSYQVAACNATTCSAASTAASATTNAVDSILLNVTGFDTTSGASISFRVNGWRDSGGVYGIETLTHNGQITSFVQTQSTRSYGGYVTQQPANGQTCNSALADPTGIAGTTSVTININCQSAASLSFAASTKTMPVQISGNMLQVAQAKNNAGTVLPTTAIRYASSNPAVATVDAVSGAVNALQVGTTTISASLPSDQYTATSATYTLTVVPNTANTRLAHIELAQSMAQRPAALYQILTPGRDALIRAYMYAVKSSATAPPVVSVQVRGSTTPITMTCPAALPLYDGDINISYNLSDQCYATIPGSQVQPGMILDIATTDGQSLSVTPVVNTSNTLHLTIVPLIINANTANVPTNAQLVSAFKQVMPLASVVVNFHAPWAPNGQFSDGLTATGEYGNVLGQVNQLRVTENSQTHYYAMVPAVVYNGTAGLGYVPGLAAVGNDMRGGNYSLHNVIVHEVGHNLSLSHAPCGGAGSPDPYFSTTPLPWANSDTAQLTAAPLYNQETNVLSSPGAAGSRTTDLMGYCGGTWFSEYSYQKIANYIRGKTNYQVAVLADKAQTASVGAVSTSPSVLLVSGSISAEGAVSLDPVQLLGTGYQADAESGSYQLRIVSSDGKTTYRSFMPAALDHVAEQHISVLMPAIPGIVSIDVMKDGKLLPKATPTSVKTNASTTSSAIKSSGQPTSTSVKSLPETATMTVSGKSVHLLWNHVRYPWLTAIYIGNDGSHTALTMRATGGDVTINLGQLSVNGSIQISLSDGLNSILKTQPLSTSSNANSSTR
ncbi:fibronectin type III domain-containing protein [Undibacterium sp. MH2W]|uniref:fibronectin type III domain-containing protein n=1 Tax=Undibacterium sp. MH2W TaxID=3413044 RepID=UPI003BF3F818